MKRIVLGILAHVDAGKTSLTEGILKVAGKLKNAGRVDHGDAFLDTYTLEKERGITIYSKQAQFMLGDCSVTLLDTPGHTDFSAEMERTLQVLDLSILVISGTEGIQAHTRTLIRLIRHYHLPCIIFVNKMDRAERMQGEILAELNRELKGICVDFSEQDDTFYENISENDEHLMEKYLDGKNPTQKEICGLIAKEQIIPVFFGSALMGQGMEQFLEGLKNYLPEIQRSKNFGARAIKILRDEKGERLTLLKVTGGVLKVKDVLKHHAGEEEESEEKINRIILPDGAKSEPLQEAEAGMVVAVSGMKDSFAGEGFGEEPAGIVPVLLPVISCRVINKSNSDPSDMLMKLKMLEEEKPELSVVFNEKLREIELCTMGEIQSEILKREIKDRFGFDVDFGPGKVLYKETINGKVEGVGHFEPLRHYAEVHLLIEAAPRGSGIEITSACSEDILEKNWQRLIMTHLSERVHRGVLTGSPLTDVKISLVRGRAHKKHTEGGDFRQATYRAVRQGLMQAESVLLEPYFDFTLEIPREYIGRGMTDIEKLHGKCGEPEITGEKAILTGYGPVATLAAYPSEVTAYTRGLGSISFTVRGYEVCHNQAEVKAEIGYDPDRDLRNPSSSVFCAHGSGFVVEWDKVREYMHQEGLWFSDESGETETEQALRLARTVSEDFIGVEEVDAIVDSAVSSNRRSNPEKRAGGPKRISLDETIFKAQKNRPVKEEYLLVDGYNIVFAWEDLKSLSEINIDAARNKLLDRMCNYQAFKGCRLTVVFDAYRLQNHPTETLDYHNISVVYTKTAETADKYIERFAHRHASEFEVTVATSDKLEQIIILGAGCRKLSADEFLSRVEGAEERLREEHGIK